MARTTLRQVLDCASPLALFHWRRANQKRQWTAAVQDAIAPNQPLATRRSARLSVILLAAMQTSICLLLLCPASAHAQGGVPLWTNSYAPGSSQFTAHTIAVDSSGNVFVTGSSATIAYSGAGAPLWTNSGSGSAIALDGSGKVFVTGSPYTTIKYSNQGVPLWTNLYSDGLVQALAVDGNGNVLVTGFSLGGPTWDFVTIKYSNAGVPLWTNRWNDGGQAYGIALDRNGNVFVTGVSANETNSDYATVAYSAGGDFLWSNRYNGPANGNDGALGIAVDSAGNVFVTGSSRNLDNLGDYATIKYSSAGVPLWTNRYNGPANQGDEAAPIAVDRAGNVFVTGASGVSSGECCDYATIKYSNDGAPLWTRRYNGPGNSQDIAHAIAVDSAGNVIVTGESYGRPSDLGGSSDYATIAYSNDGVPLWTNRYPAGGGTAIALDSSGNVFVTGYSGNNAIVTIKYSSSVPPPVHLDFQLRSTELVLSWTNAGFNLQSAPAVTGPFTNLPAVTSPYTNSSSTPRQFFRLISD